MESLVKFEAVSKYYGENEARIAALDHVSFTIEAAQLTVILGPSGAGKSTLLNLLGGMDQASSGKIYVNGTLISEMKEKELADYRGEHIGFVFQFYNLIANLTAYENVALMKEIRKESMDAKEALHRVGLDLQQQKFPSQLSGGEQQRVAIARALAKQPTLLLCDEPTGALDSETGCTVLQVLSDMVKKQGKSVVIVTHNAAIANMADRIFYMKNGKIERMEEQAHPCRVDEVNW